MRNFSSYTPKEKYGAYMDQCFLSNVTLNKTDNRHQREQSTYPVKHFSKLGVVAVHTFNSSIS